MEVWTHWKEDDLFPESAASASPSTPARLDHTHLTISWENRERERENGKKEGERERERRKEREILLDIHSVTHSTLS